jgi:hypothetical protein
MSASLFIFGGMQRETSALTLGFSDPDADPTFNVLIAYDNFEAGKQAKKTYDFLVEHLGGECEFANQMWKFDVLGIPKLRELAARDAMAADIIIISCHGTGELSDEFKIWAELWLQYKCDAIALVALLDCPFGLTSEARDTRNYLADVARRAQMEFFCEADSETYRTIEDARRLSKLDAVSTLASAVMRDAAGSRWGLNE